MDFGPNKTLIEVIAENAFGGTYFRDIFFGINGKGYKNSWKEFDQLKNIDAKFYASDYYDKNLNKYIVKTGTLLRFWENKGWINEIDPYGWFQWYFRYWLGDYSTVSRPDTSPRTNSRQTLPRLTLPRRTLPRRTLPGLDISPLRHFPERAFLRP